MDTLGTAVFRVFATMAVIMSIWVLLMGQRLVVELSLFDVAVTMIVGTIAGVAIMDYSVDLAVALMVIVLLGLLQILVHSFKLQCKTFLHKANFKPTVVVEDGKIIKANLRKVRLAVEMLLQMLREKDVFDITQVEVAVLESQGKLSVLKKAEFLPLNAHQIKLSTFIPNRVLVPVILEGELQEQVLKKMGFSPCQIQELRRKHQDEIHKVFVAFMDKDHKLHIIHDDVQESGMFLH